MERGAEEVGGTGDCFPHLSFIVFVQNELCTTVSDPQRLKETYLNKKLIVLEK